MGKGLYGAYRARGQAGGAYASSLQDIMNIGYEQEHSKRMSDIGQEISGRKFGAGQQALGVVSTVAGGMQEQKEAAGDITKAFPGAEQTYGEAEWLDIFRSAKGTEGRRGEGETRWGELGQKLGVLLGGKSRRWEVGEGVKGIEAGEYKQADILSAAKVSMYDKLGLDSTGKTSKPDVPDKPDVPEIPDEPGENMAEEAGLLGENRDTTGACKTGFTEHDGKCYPVKQSTGSTRGSSINTPQLNIGSGLN
jgi:hypothetical protein|tara:strand:- start:205 stop:954 length:750 start_codon:yes stop_codon:yes gene_type:complete